MELLGKVLGGLAAYLVMAMLGIIAIFSPNYSDELLSRLQNWSENE